MCELRSGQRDERGAAAVEYAVVTVAAASLGGVLLAVIGPLPGPWGQPVYEKLREWILQLIQWISSLFQAA